MFTVRKTSEREPVRIANMRRFCRWHGQPTIDLSDSPAALIDGLLSR